MKKDNIWLAGATEGVFTTDNKGDSWALSNTGLASNTFVKKLYLKPGSDSIYACTSTGLYFSINNGKNWVTLNNTALKTITINDIYFGANYIMLATNANGIYLSYDKAKTWNSINTGITPTTGARFILPIQNKVFIGTSSGVFSTNILTPSSWQSIIVGANNKTIAYSALSIGNNHFIGSTQGILYSKDGGVDWNLANTGMDIFTPLSFHSDETNLYVGLSGGGVWQRPLSDFGIKQGTATTENYEFSYNFYPNPTKNEIFLTFPNELLYKKLEIFNSSGQITLSQNINEQSLMLNIGHFPNGAYFVRVNGQTNIKKLIKF